MTRSGPSTLIIGGTSRLAEAIIPGLAADGHRLVILTGRPWSPSQISLGLSDAEHALVELSTYDGSHTKHWIRRYDFIISFAPIYLAARLIPWLECQSVHRGIFISSNNAALMQHDKSYKKLRQAEEDIKKAIPNSVILQPTLVMGRLSDQTIGLIIRRIHANRTLILPGVDSRNFPIHYNDVARAARHVMDRDIPPGVYSVSPQAPVTLRDIVEIAERHLDRPARLIPIPSWLSKTVGKLWPGLRGDQLRRAHIDRLPVNLPLPEFIPSISVVQALQALTDEVTLPS